MIFLFLFLLFLCAVFLVLYFIQEKFIFLNGDKIEKKYKYNFNIKFEEIFIKTSNNSTINALHFKLEKPKGVVLFCHGNKGNLIKWGTKISYFLDYNYEVLVFDYRNYGKSTGKFNEEAMYKDGLLVYNHLKKKFKEENIITYGFSLGGTFATRIAAEHNPKALILEAPFFNFKQAVKYYTKYAPYFLVRYNFRTDLYIQKVKCPTFIFHGDLDKTTFFKDSERLYDLLSSEKKEFIAIKNGTHHNVKDFAIYKNKLKEILD